VVLFGAIFFSSFLQYTSGQDVIQRYVTTKDVGAARKSLWTTMWMSVFGSIIFFALGTALYAFYKMRPELLDPAMTQGDAILPFFIMQQLPAGVAGLIIAALFAASQSSVSSSLNSVATAWSKDFDERLIRPGAADQRYLNAAKIVVVLAGVLGMGVAIFMANSGIENAFKTFLGIVGFSTGALGGVFGLGVFTRRANATGAMVGAVAGIAAVAAVKISGVAITNLLYAFIGFAACFVAGYVASLLTGGAEERAEGLSVQG
jgi:Na+/proline symporter